jgi:hypothetical protein
MIERLSRAWLASTVVLLLLAFLDTLLGRGDGLTDFFFHAQDLPVLSAVSLAAAALWLSPAVRAPVGRMTGRVAAAIPAAPEGRPATVVIGLAVLAALLGFVGVDLVCMNHPLSMDEFMATFDAVIIAHGQLAAPVAPQWRAFAPALQTMFMLPVTGHSVWVSAYLPVNAALRALAGTAGAAKALNPVLAGVSVIAIYAVGRRIWPDRRDLPLVAAALLATSSQVLVTAMTPYAMTAHMALDLVWLWLLLRGGALGHAGALIVGFLACGLHQLVFHPLFAAPFVVQLWLDRRWRTAAIYTLAYAAICAFWTFYFPIALMLSGGASAGGPANLGSSFLAARAAALFSNFDPADIGEMAKNLIRLVTWQNPLSAPLAILGFVAALRIGGVLRSLAIGLMLATMVLFVLLTYQGHGWGYRYLHGFLGSICLVAAFAWGRLTDGLAREKREMARAGFAVVAAASLLVLLPIRAWQARGFLHPYATAEAAIRRTRTGVVFVDDNGIWFGQDLVRNDPYLRNRPLVMNIGALTPGQVQGLCSRYAIALFDRQDAANFRLQTFETPSPSQGGDLEASLRACPSFPAHVTAPLQPGR